MAVLYDLTGHCRLKALKIKNDVPKATTHTFTKVAI